MIFSQTAERMRQAVELAANVPGTKVRWATASRAVGSPIDLVIEVARNRQTMLEARGSADSGGHVRTLHETREYTVLLSVYSRAPAVAGKDRGSAYVRSAQEIAERVSTRLWSDAVLDLLGTARFLGAGDVIPLTWTEDGRAVDAASLELSFRAAGADNEAAEGEGAIESIDLSNDGAVGQEELALVGEDGNLAPKPLSHVDIPGA